jgi:hypothetical protein
MNVYRNIVRLFVLVLAATSLSVGTSRAQDFEGKFTLPYPAQWGELTLQPGDYTLTLGYTQTGARLVKVRSKAAGSTPAMIMPVSHNPSRSLAASNLICVRKGGTLVIRAFEVEPLGEIIYFHVPKNARLLSQQSTHDEHTLLAAAPELFQRLPVMASGK